MENPLGKDKLKKLYPKFIKLSVIIPCLNEAETISTQLNALAEQDWSEPWEVIIADNGSTDETLGIVEQYKDPLPNLKIIDASGRKGASFARNMGVKASKGELIVFCDADDEVAPGWLAAMAKGISKYGFVASRLDARKLSDRDALKAKGNRRQRDGLIKYYYTDYFPHASTQSLGIKRSIHESINGFDENMLSCEDCDYCWRVQLTGNKLYFVPEALVNIRHQSRPDKRYRQARNWGEHDVMLHKKFRPLGLPKVTWKNGARIWYHLLKRLARMLKNGQRERWLWAFFYRIGHLKGSLKHRILVL